MYTAYLTTDKAPPLPLQLALAISSLIEAPSLPPTPVLPPSLPPSPVLHQSVPVDGLEPRVALECRNTQGPGTQALGRVLLKQLGQQVGGGGGEVCGRVSGARDDLAVYPQLVITGC